MDKDTEKFQSFIRESEVARFDVRLLEKRVQHGFMTRKEREEFLKNLPAEVDYDFTSADALEAEDDAQS
jgi:hypothetical protein